MPIKLRFILLSILGMLLTFVNTNTGILGLTPNFLVGMLWTDALLEIFERRRG